MKIVFLGTNGWYDTGTGNTICTLIDSKDGYILLDAGNGIYKADKYIKKDKPVHMFLSHFHIDHIEGLHILTKFNFKNLTIYGQSGTRATINEFLDKKYSVPLNALPYPAKTVDLKEGWNDLAFKVQMLPLVHSSKCVGYRIETDNKAISYCTDTGYCRNSVKLSKNADILISECAFLSGHKNKEWPHMNPEWAAKLAVDSKARKLILTHFDAAEYLSIKERTVAQEHARKIFKNSFCASDGKVISI